MKVTKETLEKIAHLARLEVKPEDEEALMNDLTEILTWVEKLDEVNVEGVEPLSHMTNEINAYRKDITDSGLDRERALNLAPRKDEKFFLVPKVIKDKGK